MIHIQQLLLLLMHFWFSSRIWGRSCTFKVLLLFNWIQVKTLNYRLKMNCRKIFLSNNYSLSSFSWQFICYMIRLYRYVLSAWYLKWYLVLAVLPTYLWLIEFLWLNKCHFFVNLWLLWFMWKLIFKCVLRLFSKNSFKQYISTSRLEI